MIKVVGRHRVGSSLVMAEAPFERMFVYAALLFAGYEVNVWDIMEVMSDLTEEGYIGCNRCQTTIYIPDAWLPLDVGSHVCQMCAESYSRKEWG